MFIGITGNKLLNTMQSRLDAWLGESTVKTTQFKSEGVRIIAIPEETGCHTSKNGAAVFLYGDVFDVQGGASPDAEISQTLYQHFRRRGRDFPEDVNGAYAACMWDEQDRSLLLIRDKIGVIPLYYRLLEEGVLFGTDLPALIELSEETSLHHPALLKYLLFCYNSGPETFFQGFQRLRPGHTLRFQDGRADIRKYWQVRFAPGEASEAEIGERVRERLASAVASRLETSKRTGVFLSGGLDSSTMVSLLSRAGAEGIKTFSFRCKSESFDESHYAQIVADHFGTDHRVVEYRPEDVLLAEPMTALMDEPFCDVGINIASFLLGQAASGEVDNLFTGDGGDELFAGHPVYMADKAAALFRWIPRPVRGLVFSAGRRLPDSDKKKDLKVKIKRFSESFAFPEALGTHRWRIYYQPEELSDLIGPDLQSSLDPDILYGDMFQFNKEAEGPDALSRSLESDYQTVVQFYLRRMDLVRALGPTPRIPMLDEDVVQYCGTIPSKLKIKGFSDTKYIERIAVEPLLPHEIVYRKDKLGHSIPMKNWMREPGKARDFILDLVSAETIRRRGLFNAERVQQMVDEHMKKMRNHSHRIWALAILELWLTHHEG